MREIEWGSAFKKDYRKAKAQPRHKKDVDLLLNKILDLLISDRPLPKSNEDHPLSGEWAKYRECHVKPDLLLIYHQPDYEEVLRLVRLGSHSNLFRRRR